MLTHKGSPRVPSIGEIVGAKAAELVKGYLAEESKKGEIFDRSLIEEMVKYADNYKQSYIMSPKEINELIASMPAGYSKGEISDGFHTIDELYAHRIELFIALLRHYSTHPLVKNLVWRSTHHSDGTSYDGWFVLGIYTEPGKQITYHLPMNKWEDCRFANARLSAPEWDGHTAEDVLERLKKL